MLSAFSSSNTPDAGSTMALTPSRKEVGENKGTNTQMVLILAELFRNENKTKGNPSVNDPAAQATRGKFCLGPCCSKKSLKRGND